MVGKIDYKHILSVIAFADKDDLNYIKGAVEQAIIIKQIKED